MSGRLQLEERRSVYPHRLPPSLVIRKFQLEGRYKCIL